MNKTSNYANFAVNFVSFDFRLAALFSNGCASVSSQSDEFS